MTKKFLYTLITSLLLISCKTNRVSELDYMKNIENIATEKALEAPTSTLQKGDELIIMISARDQDVVKPFNKNYSSSELVLSSTAGSNTPNAGQNTFMGPTYIVDQSGNIDFPVVGNINTAGKTLVEFKDELRALISKYVINPSVNVRITNFKVTVLGEVNRPGEYTISNGKATVLNALGLAGDLTIYGKRNDVLIVRNVDGVLSKERVNLQDANFITSDYYNLKQGDVIYVSANNTKEKTARLDPSTPIYVSIAGIIVTILALVFKK